MITESQLKSLPDSKVDCLRCETPMKDIGEVKLLVGAGLSRVLPQGLGLEAYLCPGCGKVELFA